MADEPQTADGRLPDGAATEFAATMSYGDYLALDELLACQRPKSTNHDELLFIVIHQASELWMKLMVHELEAASAALATDSLKPAFNMLARISRFRAQLNQSWDVLSTLTPADYSTFRDALRQSSGFQSYQYRLIEFRLGNKNPGQLAPHRHRPDLLARLEAALRAPSLDDEAIRLLARRGFAIAREELARDLSAPRISDASVRDAWLAVYRDTATHWDLYELAEELVDVEDWFRQWRFRHVTTVERIIGARRGTGGTSGVGYLCEVLAVRLFPELWEVRTVL